MIKAVYDEIAKDEPKNHFTVGIKDDVTHTSLDWDDNWDIEQDDGPGDLLGLGSDGTVGANKNSIKIIGEDTDNYAQGYFVYDSKKSGAMTVSHLRFGRKPIRGTYLVSKASFVACHQLVLPREVRRARERRRGRHLPAQQPVRPGRSLGQLPERQQQIIEKKLKLYTIDAYKVAREPAWAAHQHRHADLLLRDLRRAAARRGDRQDQGSDQEDLRKKGEGRAPQLRRGRRRWPTCTRSRSRAGDGDAAHAPPIVSDARRTSSSVTAMMMAGKGDLLPVSAFPVDGTFPTGTTKWEKRNIAMEIPVWDPEVCIQCNKCAMVCPHAAIRAKVYEPSELAARAGELQVDRLQGQGVPGKKYTSRSPPRTAPAAALRRDLPGEEQGSPKHKAINMSRQRPLRGARAANYDFFLDICPTRSHQAQSGRRSRARSCSSRCSSTPAPAPAAARRPTSSC
jgi:pyruvate-ferredoxin/flavodoxin oxidoreductase